MFTHLSLFSGIGGLDLAAEWAGFKTAGQCERADYPTRVLEKHWPDVPRWRDIKTLTKEDFYERTGCRTVDVISGGFPCQPFSVAGKQKGKGDDRYLWPEMRRVISVLAPSFVVCENVPGILRIAASDVVSDLENIGYHVVVFDFEAAAVGAWHRRERIAFVGNREENVAHSEGERQQGNGTGGKQVAATRYEKEKSKGCNICDTAEQIQREWGHRELSTQPGLGGVADGLPGWVDGYWQIEPDGVPRITNRRTHRSDRLKTLGNAVVPQQFYPIFKAIAEVLNDNGN